MMRKNFIGAQQCCFPFNVPKPISLSLYLHIYKNKCARLRHVSCCFHFPVRIALFLFSAAPRPMWRRRWGTRSQFGTKEKKKIKTISIFYSAKTENTSNWCNKWCVVTVSPRHCLWPMFLNSKSRAIFMGHFPLSYNASITELGYRHRFAFGQCVLW